MRYNAKGIVTLRIPIETTVHAPNHARADVIVALVEQRLRDVGPKVGELVGMAGCTEDTPTLTDIVRAALFTADVGISSYEKGDPFDCDCTQCQLQEALSRCHHEPDYTTIRSCDAGDLTCEVQCRKCRAWGSFCVDDDSVQYDESIAPAPDPGQTCADCGCAITAGESECAECKKQAVESGESWEPEDAATCPKCGSADSEVNASGYTRTCKKCSCCWANTL